MSIPMFGQDSQLHSKKIRDTLFIKDLHHELVVRVYGSRKYTSYGLYQKGFSEKLQYRPNSPFNVGFGFNYQMIGLNIGFNLPFINRTEQYGRTKFIDLQTHFYGRRLIVDFYGQRYKGFYLPDNNILGDPNSVYYNLASNNMPYLRPDLKTFNLGAEAQYLLNWQKFSFRAAFLQNEVQLKSAGSPIVGFFVGYNTVSADSSVIPEQLKSTGFFNKYYFSQSNILAMNLTIGYAYTLVLPYHFFITGSASGGIGLNSAVLKIAANNNTIGWGDNLYGTFRLGLGYNNRRYFAGVHYVGSKSSMHSPITNARQELGAGNFRISFAHRLSLKKKLFVFY